MSQTFPSTPRWQFWIDRGGTFTDLVGRRPDGQLVTHKLLSDNPEQYPDAAVAGIRHLLGLAPGEAVTPALVECVKMGTTVATNALLERKGEPTLLVTTAGFRDALRIAYQNRPRLFDRHIVLPELLYERVIEAQERMGAHGDVVQALEEEHLRERLWAAFDAGLRSVAIVFMHGYRYTAHEKTAERLARIGITGMAFLGAAGAVVLTLLLAKGVQHTLRLLLAGVIVGVVLSALRDLVELASPDILQAMQAFTLGSTAFVGWMACVLMVGAFVVCSVVAWMLARALDGLTLGEATAASLGLPLAPMRAGLVAAMALATGTAVAQTGLIAFVGLAAPHLVRSIVRVTHERHIVLSSLMGAVLLLAADILARWLLAPQELPVGVLTAALGGTYLLWLMHRRTSQGGAL